MSILLKFTWKQLGKEHEAWRNEEHLPTILQRHLWSYRFYLASKLGRIQMTERKNKTQRHGMLLVGYIQPHNQVAPLSWIQKDVNNFSPKQTKKKAGQKKKKKETAISI